MANVDWSEIPEELLRMIADRLYSGVELIRFRSICRSWRSSAAHKVFPSRPSVRLHSFVHPKSPPFRYQQFYLEGRASDNAFLSRAVFFRVAPSSSSSQQSRLIKVEELESGRKRLLCPLSRLLINHSCTDLDLLKFRVSEIHEAYSVESLFMERVPTGFKKVVLVPVAGDTLIRGIDYDGVLRCWNGELWTKIDHYVSPLTDMIVHRGQIYTIDRDGIVWWVDSSLRFTQYAPPLDSRCRDRNFVESCGELYIVDRLLKGRTRKGQIVTDTLVQRYGVSDSCLDVIVYDNELAMLCHVVMESGSKAVGFKVYRLDEEWGRWEEVKSLGDRAFVMATDCCFSVSAHEFEGCIENSIYFTDEQDDKRPGNGLNGHDLGVFKLDDGSITKMKYSYDCFQMFSPCFLQM